MDQDMSILPGWESPSSELLSEYEGPCPGTLRTIVDQDEGQVIDFVPMQLCSEVLSMHNGPNMFRWVGKAWSEELPAFIMPVVRTPKKELEMWRNLPRRTCPGFRENTNTSESASLPNKANTTSESASLPNKANTTSKSASLPNKAKGLSKI